MTKRKRKLLGRPMVARLPEGQSTGVRAFIRAQLDEHELTRAQFDVLLERGPRWTDNALNASPEMPVDAATEILTEIWARWKPPAALAFLERIRARLRGVEAPIPALVPDDKVALLVAAFERYVVSAKGATLQDAGIWGPRLRDFLDEIRVVSAGALRLDLLQQVQAHSEITIGGRIVDPIAFDDALRLALNLTGNSNAQPRADIERDKEAHKALARQRKQRRK